MNKINIFRTAAPIFLASAFFTWILEDFFILSIVLGLIGMTFYWQSFRLERYKRLIPEEPNDKPKGTKKFLGLTITFSQLIIAIGLIGSVLNLIEEMNNGTSIATLTPHIATSFVFLILFYFSIRFSKKLNQQKSLLNKYPGLKSVLNLFFAVFQLLSILGFLKLTMDIIKGIKSAHPSESLAPLLIYSFILLVAFLFSLHLQKKINIKLI